MPPVWSCECAACVADAAAAGSDPKLELLREEDRSVQVAEFSRLLAQLNDVAATLARWTPAHHFLREPLPAARGLRARLLDVFCGNVVAHLTWTHVHSVGNVRTSARAGHVRVFGPHGWSSIATNDAARASLAALPARLERMWLALDDREAASLRPAARAFAEGHSVEMNSCIFGVPASAPSVAATARLARELATAFSEFCE